MRQVYYVGFNEDQIRKVHANSESDAKIRYGLHYNPMSPTPKAYIKIFRTPSESSKRKADDQLTIN